MEHSDARFKRADIAGGEKIEPFEGAEIRAQLQGNFNKEDASTQIIPNGNQFGRPAVMNEYAVLTLSGASSKGQENTLFDRSNGNHKVKKWYEKEIANIDGSVNPSVENLIKFGSADSTARRTYAYKDFAFLSFFDFIPNNRLITLRRFPAPTTDSLDFPGMNEGNEFRPIAQACTYFGEDTDNKLSDFFNISTELPWEDMEAKMWDIDPPSNTGADSMGSKIGGIAKFLSVASGDASASSIRNAGRTYADPYEKGPYANKVKGPVNRIDSVKKRQPGLKMSQSITLNFSFTPRPFNDMNSKAIALDIIANMYALTYASAPFWGGDNRFMSGGNAYPAKALMKKWYAGDPMGFMGEMGNMASKGFSNITSAFGDIFSGGGLDALKNIAKKGMNLGMAKMVAGKNDTFLGMRSILTGEPVGEWHITVGNPLNPIMELGNMVATKMEMSSSEELGPDDFPTWIKFSITLEHGMPRDSDAIQSMFNKGYGRIYKMPDELMQNLASLNETKVDAKTGKKDLKPSAKTVNQAYAVAAATQFGFGKGSKA